MASKDEWITTKKAAEILTEKSGHKVDPDYVRQLAYQGRVAAMELDGRTKLYKRSDIEGIQVDYRPRTKPDRKKPGPKPGTRQRTEENAA